MIEPYYLDKSKEDIPFLES